MNLLTLILILLGLFLVGYGIYNWYLILFTDVTYTDKVFESVLVYISITATLLPLLVLACIVFVTILWSIVSYLASIQLW